MSAHRRADFEEAAAQLQALGLTPQMFSPAPRRSQDEPIEDGEHQLSQDHEWPVPGDYVLLWP